MIQFSVTMSCSRRRCSRICCASFASGVFVKSMSVVRADPSSAELDAPASTKITNHTPTVRHGCLLLARAIDSGFSLIRSSLTLVSESCLPPTYTICLQRTEYRRTM